MKNYNAEEFEKAVRSICDDIANLLISKNKAYGNSALDPINCFFKGDAGTSIRVRIDDKLSRIMRGNKYADEDTIKDLLGYLVLLKIAEPEKDELPF